MTLSNFIKENMDAIVQEWCARAGIAYGGRADIGHDADNRVVPFGNPAV